MKSCNTCQKKLDLSKFSKDKRESDGLQRKCKDCSNQFKKNWYERNKEAHKAKIKAWKIQNKEKNLEYNKKWSKKNKHKVREYIKRYRLDPEKRHVFAARAIIYRILERMGKTKNSTTQRLLGYSYSKFKERIEYNFKPGMTWENHGDWHIDHIKPVSAFPKDTPMSIINALSNLRPLWANENLTKSNKYDKTRQI